MYKLYLRSINDVGVDEYSSEYNRLNFDDRTRIDRKKCDDAKRRTLLGRILARKAISELCGNAPEDIEIVTDSRGKPYAVGIDAYFSISHSGDWVVCAAGSRNIGVDIERIRHVEHKLVDRVCTQSEMEYVSRHADADIDRIKRFFEVWTLKEAYFKAVGTGITDFKSVDVFRDITQRETRYLDNYVISIVII